MYQNIQAYDRGVMFSPDGRLFQVDYAREAVRKGATSVGIVAEDGVVLIAHKNLTEPLAVPSTVQKIFKIDANIGATYSGFVSDGLRLVNIMRQRTQTHRMVYDETESIETIAREVAEEMQITTQYGGIRPYGISLLIGGFDKVPKLYEIDAAGSFLGYKADAIGSGKAAAQEMLTKEYKDEMTSEQAAKLGITVIKKVTDQRINAENIDISIVTGDNGFKLLTPDEITKFL
ncbi:MAG: archaeal proteasome endopeptidase complex subunit alpha [Candidatus Marsarchaeota archaeon]|nr:archaeal proteasome endopeptidase complex subunit alpha [Candidatus Marsarchaeota archaeon]